MYNLYGHSFKVITVYLYTSECCGGSTVLVQAMPHTAAHCTKITSFLLNYYLTTEKNVWQPLTTMTNLTKPKPKPKPKHTHTHTHLGALNNTALHSTSSSCEHAPLTVRGTAGGGGGDSDGGGYLLER